MVEQKWIEDKLSKMEADRLGDNWSLIREKQFQYLLEIYRTGKFSLFSYNKIIEELESVKSNYCK